MIEISFEKITLSNGLEVILHEDHSIPLVAVNVWYHVGSKDEEPGRTGFAHLFEHLMFEGSLHHNRSHFEPLQQAGATLNGSTNTDRTNYWENVPPNYLELALWLEADRMGFLLEALDEERFHIQREVVKNERRQSYENRPYGMARSLIQASLFPLPHPYHWWTIGSPEDLDAASLEDVKAFFRRFYGPSNSSLAIAGDFQKDEVVRLVHRYFDDLPPGALLSRMNRRDSDLRGQVSLTMYDRVQLPRLYLTWPALPRFHPDDAPLTFLAEILGGGNTSRLYRALVYEKQIAQDVRAHHFPAELTGEFGVEVTVAPGHSLEEVQEAADTEIERLRREPPREEEIVRAKNGVSTRHVYQLELIGGFGGRADRLNSFNVLAGDPGLLNSSLDRYLAVEAGDLQRVASTLLGDRHVRLQVLPERSLAPATTGVDRSRMPEPGAAPSFTPPVPQRRTLANGMGVMVVEKRNLPIVVFGLLLHSGAVTDGLQRSGLTHLTTTMLSEGTATRSSQQIAEEFDLIGSQLSTSTGREHVLLAAEALKEHWPRALELVADVVQHSTFPQEELVRVQREHLTNLRRAKDEPVIVAERVARMLLYGPESLYGHPMTGTEKAVAALTRDDLVTHFRDHYGSGQATLIVVGDVSLEEVVSRAEEVLGRWGASPVGQAPGPDGPGEGPSEPTTIFLIDKPGAAQSVVRVGHLGVPRTHANYYALTLLNYAFGGQFTSRLNMNLREGKGYTYGYRSTISWLRGSSALVVGGGVHTAVTKEAVAETLGEFADIRGRRPLTQEEFETAKASILRGLPTTFETAGDVLEHLMELLLFDLPDAYYSTFRSEIEALSLEDVHRVAADWVDEGHLMVLVVGDQQIVESPLRELGLPLVLMDHEGREST